MTKQSTNITLEIKKDSKNKLRLFITPSEASSLIGKLSTIVNGIESEKYGVTLPVEVLSQIKHLGH